ncbi:MAG TPA: hypothetical protein VEC36_09460 [Patescibacteria group bacterium]|nr:hypothetical protein [Patescibacteria group bacterium]
MFLKSFFIILLVALNCTTLNSTQEKRLPEIRFLKVEKGKYENTYWFYFIKNTADTNLLIKIRSANSDTSEIELGFNFASTQDSTANSYGVVSTHAEWMPLSILKDTVLVRFKFNPRKDFTLVGAKFLIRKKDSW